MNAGSRTYAVKTMAGRAAVVVLVAVFLAVPRMGGVRAAEAPADPAAEKLRQAEQEQAAAVKAQGRGEEKAAAEYAQNAQRLLEEARNLHLQRISEAPRDPRVLTSYGEFLTTVGSPDLAAETLRHAVSLEPGYAEAWLALGQALRELDPSRAKQAQQALNRATELAADDTFAGRAWAAVGLLYWEQGLYEFAAESFETALTHDPGQTDAKIGLAGTNIRLGQVAAASRTLDAMTALTQEQQALVEKVVKEGLDAYDRVRMWYPDTAESHLAYAKLAIRANRFVDCLVALRRAASLEPGNPVIWNFLGSVYAGVGESDRAREAFQRSLELNPDQPRTRSALDNLPDAKPADAEQTQP